MVSKGGFDRLICRRHSACLVNKTGGAIGARQAVEGVVLTVQAVGLVVKIVHARSLTVSGSARVSLG